MKNDQEMNKVGTLSIGKNMMTKFFFKPRFFFKLRQFPIVWSLLCCLFSVSATAQSGGGAAETQHTKDKADQTLRGNARVNPSTLGMEFSLPIAQYPGRGGSSLPLTFNYSSKLWRLEAIATYDNGYGNRTHTITRYAEETAAGWTSDLGTVRLEYPGEQYDCQGNVIPEVPVAPSYCYKYIKRIKIKMPDGSTHELRKDDAIHDYVFSTGLDWTGAFLATDGSRLRAELGVSESILYLPDGGRYFLQGTGEQTGYKFIDRHGNQMTFNRATRTWTDTLGRSLTSPLPLNLEQQEQIAGTQNFSLPGLANQAAQQYQLVWKNLGDGGVMEAGQVPAYEAGQICGNGNSFGLQSPALFTGNFLVMTCAVTTELFNPVVLSEVVLPTGAKYQFQYNNFGEIVKIKYPTGGYERFEYAKIPVLSLRDQQTYDKTNRGVIKRWVSSDGTTEEQYWQYSVTKNSAEYKVRTVAPNGSASERYLHRNFWNNPESGNYGFDDPRNGMAFDERTFDTNEVLRSRSLTEWVTTEGSSQSGYQPRRDPRPKRHIGIVFEPGSSSALATLSESIYETAGENGAPTEPEYFAALNVKQAKSYHFKTVDLTTARNSTIDQISALFAGANPAAISETDYRYDPNYKARNITGLAIESRVIDPSNNQVTAKSQISYDDGGYSLPSTGSMPWQAANSWLNPLDELGITLGSKRGLPTTVRSYSDIAANQYVETHTFYDQYGNLRLARDGRNNETEIEYSATYAFAYPTKTISAVPVTVTGQNGSTTSFETTAIFDYNTGLPTSSTDANGLTTEMEYDAALRPFRVTPKQNGNVVGSVTETTYGVPDANGQLTAAQRFVKVRTQIDGANWKTGFSGFDGLGRSVKSQSVDSSGDVYTETEYDTMGRAWRSTNPYRTGETKVWTENFFDTAGRLEKVKTLADNAEVTTAYSLGTGTTIGTVVTVTDQAGKQRRSITNALGQLTRVDEPTDANGLGTIDGVNQSTSYSYDILNNLITVNQGSQTRSFVYDSLSRLKTATNPESGTINYSYDANGNLTSKTDARGVQTAYVYDNLNRVQTRSYANEPSGQTATPTVSYFYDNLANAKGKLIKASSAVSQTEYTEFDIMGRVKAHKQTTDGNAYTTGYIYNLSGALIEETYPSTRVVKNVLDNDGDLSIVQSRQNGNTGFWNYAKNMTYTAAGAVSSMQLGNGKWESTSFNPRLQPTQIALGTVQNATDKLKLNYDYGTTTNNGNVLSQTITVQNVGTNTGFSAAQSYTYDAVNRLKSATENITPNGGASVQSWKQTFLYDRYGNRNFDTTNNNTTTIPTGCSTAQCNPAVSVSNNRFTSGQGYSYDSAGNVITDAQGRTFAFDAENKQKEVRDVNNIVIGTYFYDGDGKRVKKVTNTETTIFVYDASGKLVAEYSNQTVSNPQVSYLTQDNLGSPRITTDANGNVISRRDFHPFGEEVFTQQRTQGLGYSADYVRQKFATYQRDTETDLDFAQARYYTKNLGRFNSVDPIMLSDEHKGNPQRWNAYVYVLNCPTTAIDPDGKNPKRTIDVFITLETSKEDRAKFNKLRKDAAKNGVRINIYRTDNNTATAEKFIKSIQTKGRTTILVGHSSPQDELPSLKSSITGRYYGAGIGFSGSMLSTQDNVEKGLATDTVDGTYTQAKTLAVFACDFGAVFDKLGSTKNTNFLSFDNGRDGKSSISAGIEAALSVTRVIANGGNARQAREGAQKVLDNSGSTYDAGDRVKLRVLKPVEIEIP